MYLSIVRENHVMKNQIEFRWIHYLEITAICQVASRKQRQRNHLNDLPPQKLSRIPFLSRDHLQSNTLLNLVVPCNCWSEHGSPKRAQPSYSFRPPTKSTHQQPHFSCKTFQGAQRQVVNMGSLPIKFSEILMLTSAGVQVCVSSSWKCSQAAPFDFELTDIDFFRPHQLDSTHV